MRRRLLSLESIPIMYLVFAAFIPGRSASLQSVIWCTFPEIRAIRSMLLAEPSGWTVFVKTMLALQLPHSRAMLNSIHHLGINLCAIRSDPKVYLKPAQTHYFLLAALISRTKHLGTYKLKLMNMWMIRWLILTVFLRYLSECVNLVGGSASSHESHLV